ncbi:uncharacterized [Tachysurus ichikawai]
MKEEVFESHAVEHGRRIHQRFGRCRLQTSLSITFLCVELKRCRGIPLGLSLLSSADEQNQKRAFLWRLIGQAKETLDLPRFHKDLLFFLILH